MNCPEPAPVLFEEYSARSLYLLYAHMRAPAGLKVGDAVACGERIGEVGTTGSSVNDHLHLETRVGPSGARFAGMGFRDAVASETEYSQYCAWRVSGQFSLFDPMLLLSIPPQ
jgi:murein DD-endopeptidase MepM/ murein hydrolase activator NlpD